MSADLEPVVVVTRDPDASNVIELHGVEAQVIDVDLGRSALDDPDEFDEWQESMAVDVAGLPLDHPARESVRETVVGIAERYGHVMDEDGPWR